LKAGRYGVRTFSWDSIDTSNLTKDHLKTLYKLKGFKEVPDITQIGKMIIIQYKDKAPILLDCEKGQIFLPEGYPIKSVKNQLEKVAKVLDLDSRILPKLRKTTLNQKYSIPFISKVERRENRNEERIQPK
jgi:hypothetical protein